MALVKLQRLQCALRIVGTSVRFSVVLNKDNDKRVEQGMKIEAKQSFRKQLLE
jgi:hypothetical protein